MKPSGSKWAWLVGLRAIALEIAKKPVSAQFDASLLKIAAFLSLRAK